MENQFKIVPVQMWLGFSIMSEGGPNIYEKKYTSLEEAKKAINLEKWPYVIVIDESKKQLVHFACKDYCLTQQITT